MGEHNAFFYGTLMAPEVLYRVCYGTSTPSDFYKSMLTIRPAILHSYSRHKVRHCDYPAVIPQAGNNSSQGSHSVRGTFVSGLTDGDIWRLDIFEGDEYERKNVQVKLLSTVGDDQGVGNVEGEELTTQTYVWIAGRDRLEDGQWNFGDFVRDKMKRWIGTDDEYEGELRPSIAEVDEAVKGSDPTGGRGRGGGITEALDKKGSEKDEVLASAV